VGIPHRKAEPQVIQVADEGTRAATPEWVRGELGGATGSGIRVAVLDSGWDRSIDDPRVLPGTGFVDPDDDFALARNDDDQDVLGHGTACADVILGVAPDARVVPVKVFGNKLETSPGTLEAALHWAIDAGVQVINVSLGTRLEGTLHPLYRACEMARQKGIIVVAAGHNANDWSYPAIFENVIGVSAARFDSPYHFHYRAEHAMECVGWGVDRPVLWVGGERVVRHGTSFAAPGVAGIVALILERHPQAKLEDVREMLARFALPGGEDDAPASMSPTEQAQAQAAKKPRKRKAAAANAPDSAASPTAAKKPRKRAGASKKAADPAEPAKSSAPRRSPRKKDPGDGS
jgi:subtilisin